MPSLFPVDLKRDASRRCFISLLAAAGLAIAPLRTALAQAYYDGAAYFSPVVNWSGPLLAGSSMNSYIKRAKTSRTDDAGRQPSPREKQRERTERSSFAALRVSSDPRISAQVKDQFRQQLIQANHQQIVKWPLFSSHGLCQQLLDAPFELRQHPQRTKSEFLP